MATTSRMAARAAWIGLVPGQYSSGGSGTGTGHQGRRQLSPEFTGHGARAILSGLGDKQDGAYAAGRAAQKNDAATRKPWWRLPPRMRGWRGRCCTTARIFGYIQCAVSSKTQRKASIGRYRNSAQACCRTAARNHQCAACVDVKRVDPRRSVA